MFFQLRSILENLVTALLLANTLLGTFSDILILLLMHFLDMSLHICLELEPLSTTFQGACKQLPLMLKHMPVQVIFSYIAEGAVFKWAGEGSLQSSRKNKSKLKLLQYCY
jgi:hypothetical protein